MKTPQNFYKPLSIGAPQPLRELPLALERTVHFLPPHNEKICAKAASIIAQVDVLLGNLEDAIPAEAKEAARAGFIRVARENDFSNTGLWTRVNALNSPWFLDDVTAIVGAVGDKLDVLMVPKVEGDWDIHYVDQLLAQLEAKHRVQKPILIHAILETAEGVKNVDAIAAASPRMHGMSLGPADLAASRGMKTTRVGGGHPAYGVIADEGQVNGLSSSKTCGTTQSPRWSTLAVATVYAPSTDRLVILAIQLHAKLSFETRSYWGVSVHGHFTLVRSTSQNVSLARRLKKSCLPSGFLKLCPMEQAPS